MITPGPAGSPAVEGGRGPEPTRLGLALDLTALRGPAAAQLGTSSDALALWETGELVPSWAQVRALAEQAELPLEWFWAEPITPLEGFVCTRTKVNGARCQRFTYPPPPNPPRQGILFS